MTWCLNAVKVLPRCKESPLCVTYSRMEKCRVAEHWVFGAGACGSWAGSLFFHQPVYQHGKQEQWPHLTRPLTQISTAHTVWSGWGGHTPRSSLSLTRWQTVRLSPCVWGNREVNVCLWELGLVPKCLRSGCACVHTLVCTHACHYLFVVVMCFPSPLSAAPRHAITALTETSLSVLYSHWGNDVNKAGKRRSHVSLLWRTIFHGL